jgi:LacI family transcriptional regulator
MNEKPIRLTDVAAKAGVSITTVSLSLNGNPRISEKVRKRIQKIAHDLGYRRDPIAKALQERSGSKGGGGSFFGTVGLIMSKACAKNRRANPYCEQRDQMLETSCNNMGYSLNRFEVGLSKSELKSLDRILEARNIRGLFLYGDNEDIHAINLDWSRYAAVAYSGSLYERFIHNVMSLSYQDAYAAIDEIRKLGYKKPGCFIPGGKYKYLESGLSAGLSLWENSGKSALFCHPYADDHPAIKEKFGQWIRQYNPDVVVASDVSTLGWLKEGGSQVPAKTGFACLDVPPDQTLISGMVQPREFVCKTMADILHGMLMRHEYGPPVPPMCIQIPAKWNPGQTLRSLT